MIKIENIEIVGWKPAIRGMRNPMNSWERSDSVYLPSEHCDTDNDFTLAETCGGIAPIIKRNDNALMMNLADGGPVHAKYRRMIVVYADITAPLYWWKEFDTYKVGTVSNSCSTMHKIADKEFALEDFSCEHLMGDEAFAFPLGGGWRGLDSIEVLTCTIEALNNARTKYLETKDKKYWWQMIQLLPSSYNQRRTEMLNYEVLANIYKWRKNHKLDEWCVHDGPKKFAPGMWGFCDWIESLPYSELITGKEN